MLYTKDCLIETLKNNEEIKGKIVDFSDFRKLLLEELEKNFPKDYQVYKRYRHENGVNESDDKQQ